ncbi:MAG: hypothetical protein NTY19_39760 [Planctomycetota bacterium]|nr:hypothetical protein [Planctomycetota bacterium]
MALIGLGLGAWGPVGGRPSQSLFLCDDLAAAAEERTAEPATVEAAARVLDLRTFPVMDGARVGEMRSLGMLNYEAQGGAKTAFEFQQKKLRERGWKELPGAYIDAANASSKFAKNGFVVAVSTSNDAGDPQKAGWSHVFLVNHGNVAVGKLPVPPGVKPFHPDVTQASYITEAKVAETAAACRKLLLAAAWEPYGSAGSPESPMMYFKRNAIQLTAWVSTAPAAGGKTLIRYDTALLSADLPVPPDAPDPRYTDFQRTLRSSNSKTRTDSSSSSARAAARRRSAASGNIFARLAGQKRRGRRPNPTSAGCVSRKERLCSRLATSTAA